MSMLNNFYKIFLTWDYMMKYQDQVDAPCEQTTILDNCWT